MKVKLFLFLVALLSFSSCMTKRYVAREYQEWEKDTLPHQDELAYSIYLFGDPGAPFNMEQNFEELSEMIKEDTASSTIFLGDNIYLRGLPPEGHPEREDAEDKMNRTLETVEDYPGKVFFIPGNHDWDYMGREGRERVLLQEAYVEEKLNRGNTFVPDNACPGPFKVSVSDELVIIFLDTQWWLHKYSKPEGDPSQCEAISANDVIVQLEDIVNRNKGRHIVVAGHHPLYTNGNHGGYFNILDHIFPLRLIQHEWYMYVPLPVLGSLYPLFRKFGGSAQDLPNYTYQNMRTELMRVFSEEKDIIYVAGHEHDLQYFKVNDVHTVVSGSGCKVNPVRRGGKAAFIQKNYGFARIGIYTNGEAWLEFFAMDQAGKKSELSFRTRLYKKFEIFPESYCSLSEVDYSDSTVNVAASSQYKVKKFKKFMLGEHYRKAWGEPIDVELLDMKSENGGIIPYGIGGGKQSVSIKFKNTENREYVARTIEKDPQLDQIVKLDLDKTWVDDLVQDQISAQHPYAAIAIAPMADKLGIFHTNPQIKFIPQDSCLGPYFDKFSNTLVLFEDDPDESHKDAANLGFSENIIGTDKLLTELREDNDNSVDYYTLAKARLFDILIGDWDRHEKQFRWAEFEKEGKGELFVPVPEDRDQAFFKFDGFLPNLVSRKWGARMLRDFGSEVKDLKGLGMAAKNLDRRFLSALSEEEWIDIAELIKNELTDQDIEEAIKKLPPTVFALNGPEIIEKLKSRRDKLPETAKEYYHILAEFVNIYGSKKHEFFKVERLNNQETRITVYKSKKEGELKDIIYQRLVKTNETREVRLYGMGGNDRFLLTGDVEKGVLVRIVGGSETDSVINRSSVHGFRRHVLVYDNPEDVYLDGEEIKPILDSDPEVIDPEQDQFFYNYTGPAFDFMFNQGDGVFLGFGLIHKRYKFRADPYGSRQKAVLSYASATRSFRFNYLGDFRRVFGKNDLLIYSDFFLPYFAMNYFGYGNNSPEREENIQFYRVQMHYGVVFPAFVKRFTSFMQAGIGPKFEYYNLVSRQEGLVSVDRFSEDIFQQQYYGGMAGFFKIGSADDKLNPTRGLILQGLGAFSKGLNRSNNFFTHFESDFRFYASPNLPFQLTLAGRVGGAINTGNFDFYQANTLGGLKTIRGYYRTRFTGDKTFYQNLELRSQIIRINAYVLSGRIGLAAFIDNGRVWPGGGDFHQGYGGGVWFSIIDKAIFSTYYGISEESNRVNFNLGFFF